MAEIKANTPDKYLMIIVITLVPICQIPNV